jgi:hypothetical protein
VLLRAVDRDTALADRGIEVEVPDPNLGERPRARLDDQRFLDARVLNAHFAAPLVDLEPVVTEAALVVSEVEPHYDELARRAFRVEPALHVPEEERRIDLVVPECAVGPASRPETEAHDHVP